MLITVIGAGIAGLACAVELAERGASVEVIDQSSHLGASCCSWYAGGMLAPWCERESAEPLVAELGAESIPWWRKRLPSTAMGGSLVVALGGDNASLAQFARRTEQYEWLDGDGIAALEPDLAGRFNRALYFRDEGHLEPRAALAALEARLIELGVAVRYGTEAATAGVAGRQIVDCTGLAARRTLTDLRGVKGEMLVLHSPDITLSRPVRVLHPRVPVYIVPRPYGHFMVGATSIESDQPTRISARSMLELLGSAYSLHPAFGEAEIVEIGTGVRPAFPDNLPRLRWHDGTLFVNGLYRHGFLLAPSLACRAAQAVLHGRRFPEVMDEAPRERRLA